MIFRSNFFRRPSEGEPTGSTKRGKNGRSGRTRQRSSRRADFRRLLERDLRFESLEARRVLAALGGMHDIVGSDLAGIFNEYLSSSTNGETNGPGVTFVSERANDFLFDGSSVFVEVRTTGEFDAMLGTLQTAGFRTLNQSREHGAVDGFVPIGALETVGADPSIYVYPVWQDGVNSQGSQSNEAELTLLADFAKTIFGSDGTGVTVGVISDTANSVAGGLADSIATGDLPGGVTMVVPDVSPGIDEGRAMMELVYDIAEGAALQFASGQPFSDLAIGTAIDALRLAGSDIIVDDLISIRNQPWFQDGIASQAVTAAFNAGIPYFSSAGNRGTGGFETPTNFSNSTVFGLNGDFQDFDLGGGTDYTHTISLSPGNNTIYFQYDQPLGGVTSDLDIRVYDMGGTLIDEGLDFNTITQRPWENVSVFNPGPGLMNVQLTVELFSGPAPTRFKWINIGGNPNGPVEHTGQAGTFVTGHEPGHSGSANAIAVGAAFFGTPTTPQGFTSVGPTTRSLTPGGAPMALQVIQNPNITAHDGVSTSVPGFGSFFGTSAAAPNAAAIAALMLSVNPSLTPSQVANILASTATDIGAPGFDLVTGAGVVNGVRAVLAANNGVLELNGTAGNDEIEIQVNAGDNTLLDVIYDGVTLGQIPLADFTTIEVNGLGGSDTLRVDFANGNPVPAGGIVYTAGESAGDNDTLEIIGYNVGTVAVTHAGPESGSVVIGGASPISFFETEPLLLGGTAANLVINLPAGGNPDAVLGDDLGGVAGVSEIRGSTFEDTTFTNPTTSLTVNAFAGADTITMLALDAAYAATTNINTGNGIDQVRIAATPANTTTNVDTQLGVPGDLLIIGAIPGSGGTIATTPAQFNSGQGTLDFLGANSIINYDDDGGVGELYVDDSGDATADNVTVTSGSITGASAATVNYVGPNVNIVQLALGTGNDTVNVNSTGADDFNGGTTTIFGNNGNDTFNIAADTLSGRNVFHGDNGNDTFNLNFLAGTTVGQNAVGYSAFSSLQIDGNSPASDPANRDTVNLNTNAIGDGVRNVTINYLSAAPGDIDVTGLGGTIDLSGIETLDYNGDAANNDTVTVVGTSAADDLITVAPIDGDRALVFNNSPLDVSGPFNSPPQDFASRIPGVSGGSVRPDLDLSGLANLTGLTITDPGPGTGDRLFVYGESSLGLNDGNAFNPFGFGPGQILPAVGEPAAFDVITVSDTRTTVDGHVAVNYNATDFIQANPATQPAVVINGGNEGNPPATPGVDVADDITLVASGTYRFQVNGGDPDPDSTGIVPPDGDRLFTSTLGDLSVFSDKASPPNVSVIDASGNLPFGFSSIENLLLDAQGGAVNLLGDNNFTQDQTDNFVVRGTGPNAFTLEINGSAPIQFVNVTYLNVVGGEDIDTLDIMAWADNTTQGWGIQVFFDEGAPDQTDGGQEDLLIYNTVGANPVSENIVIQPSGPESGELRVTNAVDGSAIVIISYVNNLDVIVHDNDGYLSDTDTLTLRGTNPDPGNLGAPSGLEDFLADFSAAGDVANPMVTVFDAVSALMLYRLRNFTNFNSINIEPLGGSDYLQITGRDDGSLVINVDNGDPTGPGSVLDVDTLFVTGTNGGSDSFTFAPGADPDSGRLDVTRAGAFGTTVINFTATERLVIDGGGGDGVDTLNVDGTAAANLFTVNPVNALNGTVSVDAFPVVSYQSFGAFSAVLNFNGGGNGDAFRLAGTAGPDLYTYIPTASDSATLTLDNGFNLAQFNLSGFGSALLDADTSVDNLNVTVDNALITPGVTSDSGRVTATAAGGQGLLPLDYVNLENVTVVGGAIVVNGTAGDDVITVHDSGLVTVANQGGVVLNSYDLAGASTVIINALGGNDTVVVNASVPFVGSLTVIGGEPGSGSDTLNLVGAEATAENVLIRPDFTNPAEQVVVGLGGLITVSGIELITYTGAGGDDNLTVETGSANDIARLDGGLSFDELTSSSLPTIRFTGVNDFTLEIVNGIDTATVNPTFLLSANRYFVNASVSDTVIFEGAGDDDLWTLTNPLGGDSLMLTDNSFAHSGAAVTVMGNPQDIVLDTRGGDDLVTVDVSVDGPIPLPLTFHGGDGSDTLLVVGTPPAGAFDSVTYSPGPVIDAGRLEYALGGNPAMRIDFTGLEPVIDATPAATLIVNGTDADNAINYTQGSIAAHGLVSVDGFESIEFTNKTNLVINGLAGSDTINLNNPNTPTGLASITVNGGDPTASDVVIVNGTTGPDTVNFAPTAADAMTVTGLGPQVQVAGADQVVYDGQGGNDDLTVTSPLVFSTTEWTFTPGVNPDSGRISGFDTASAAALLGLTFQGVGNFGNLNFANSGGPRNDGLDIHGTGNDDQFDVNAAGAIQIVKPTFLLPVSLNINTPGITFLRLLGGDGDDIFNVPGDHPFDTGMHVEGGNPSASDVLNFAASGAGQVILDLDAQTITEVGFSPVSFTGVEQVDIAALGNSVLVFGALSAEELSYTPATGDSGSLQLAGLNTVFNLDGVSDLTLDSLGGIDTVSVLGTEGDDSIVVTGTQVAVNALLPLNYTGVESLRVLGLDGSDTFTVTPSALTSIFLDGGDPIGVTGDRLVLTSLSETAFSAGPQADEGGFTFASELPVSFAGIEEIELDLLGNAFTHLGTHGDDVITVVGTGADAYTISINDGPALAVSNSGDLTIDALSGNDQIVIDVNALTLSDVTVVGGQPQATGDRLTVSGTDASWTPSTGTLLVDAQPITVSEIETLSFDGENAGGSLTVVGGGGGDVFRHTPGTALDAGRVAVTGNGTTQLGIGYSGLGLGGTVTIEGAGGDDTLIAEGTQSADAFQVGAGTGTVTLSDSSGTRVPLLQTDIGTLTLDGLDGDDLFFLSADLPYNVVQVLGGNPGGSDLLQINDVGGSADTFVVSPGFSEGLGVVSVNAVPITYVGIENLLLMASADDGDSLTINDDQADNTWTVKGGPILGDRVQIDGRETIDFVAFDTVELVNTFGSDVFHIHPTDLIGFNTSLTVTGDGDDALVIHGTTANDTLASVPGGGVQGAASANGVSVLFGGLASVELLGGDGDDVFDVTPIVGVNTLVTGGEPSAADRLNVTVPGDVRTTQGATSTSGRIDQTGAGPVDYTGIESMSIASFAGGTLTSRATHDNDTIALQFLGGANRIWINDGTVTAFSNFDVVTLQGLFGDDTFSVHPTGLVGVTTVNVEGGDPTASDSVIVNGTTVADDITYRPSGFDSGSVEISGSATVNFTTTEHLTLNGLGGGDSLTIDTFDIDGTQVLTPGSTFDSGRVDFRDGGFATNNAVALDFLGLDVGGSLTFTDIGRLDNLIYRGTDTDDTFVVTSGGQVLLNGQLPVNTPSIITLTLAGLDGDDTFEIAGDHNLPGIVVEGGNPSASDVLVFTGSGSGQVTTNLGAATIAEAGFGTVSYTGIELIQLDAGGLGTAVVATDDDDDVTVTVLGASSGTVQIGSTAQQDGQAQQTPAAPRVHYTNTVGNAVDIDLLGGQDTLIVVGNALPQAFVVDGLAQTVTIDDNDNGSNDGTVTYQNAESLAVYGLEGSDTFTVTGGPIPIFIDGGDPIGAVPGDSLILTNAFAFFAGPQGDEGGFLTTGGPEGIVSFDHIESIIVAPPELQNCPFVIFGTNSDDDITVIARDASTHAGTDGLQDFTVSINAGIEILFIDQPNLVIDALAGDDDVVIRGPAPNQAAWDMQLTLIGGPASGITGDQGDVLMIETPGLVNTVYTPTGSDTGTLLITNGNGSVANLTIQSEAYIPGPDCPPLPPPVMGGNGGFETLIYDGEGFGDSLTIVGTAEADTIVHTPGAGIDEGQLRINTLLGMRYQNLAAGELIVDGGGDNDVLVVDGTGQSDTFTVAANTGGVTLANSHGTRLEIQQVRVEELVLNGLDGDDTFRVQTPQPYTSLSVNGGGPGASDVLEILDVIGADDTFLVDPGFGNGEGTVTVNAVPINYLGVEHLLLRASGDSGDNLTVEDDLADNTWTVNAGPTFGDRLQVDGRESVDFDGFDSLTLINTFGEDRFLIHPTHLIGTERLTVISNAGGVRDDVVTIIATDADDVVTSTADTITVNDSVPITVGNAGSGFAEVQLIALGGDDHVTLSLELPGVRKFVDGGAGNDFIDLSGTLDAVIFGGDGDDFIIGSPIADFIDGGRGNDILFGGGGNDAIYGGEGNDTLIGGTGADQMFGGVGDDTFIWNPGDGSDLIDGGTGNNVLQFVGGAAADAFALSADGTRLRLTRQPGNVVMDVANVQQVDVNVTISLSGLLSGAEEVPPVATAATGRTFLTYNSSTNTFDIDLFIQGITPADLVGAHIHVGPAGANGPVIFNLGTADWFLDGGGLRRRISGATFPVANIGDLLSGNTYVNIHTVANPGGEIRSQLNPLAAGQGLGGADTFEIFDLHQTDVRVVNLGLGVNNGGPVDAAADDVRVHGRTTDDNILITSRPNPAGGGFADLVNVAGLRYDINLSDAVAADGDELTVLGNQGNDFIHAEFGVEETILITLDGGAGNDHLIANGTLIGGAGDDLLVGGPGENLFFGGDGDDTFIGGGGNDTYDGGAGFDTILVEGTPGADLIDVFQSADNAVTYSVNGAAQNETLVVGTVEEVRVEAGAGADLVRVRTADVLFDQVGTALRMTVNGGSAPGAGDRLVVIDDGTDDLTLYRKGFVATEGTVEVGPGNEQPFLVVFSGIERVQFLDENGMTINQDAATGPRLAVFQPDPFEYNDDRLVATHLGAAQTINLVANIDPGPILDPFADGQDIPGDQDWYRFVAEITGTLDLQVYFTQIGSLASGRPGLPADGNLDIEVLDAAGNVIAGFGVNDATDDERRRIPAVAGQTYFLRVTGNNNAINAYNMTVLNVAPPVPFDIELQDTPVGDPPPDNSDTGRSQFDNVTRDNTPTIFLRLDDGSFRFDVQGNDPGVGGFPNNPPINTIPIPFRTLQQPGYRVAIFDEGPTPGQPATNPQIPVGFAEAVAGSPGLYRFTFPVALSDGSHFISARVQMIDPSAPQQTGFGGRSESMEIIVDTVPPPVHFGLPAVANDGLHPDSDSGVEGNPGTFTDRITNDTTPTFWGTAEANSIVRAYIDVNGNGTVDDQDILIGFTVALPFDGSNQFPDGRWELTSTVDMNSTQARNLAGGLSPLPEDGLRPILVTAEDVAGNLSAADSLNIFVDTQGPQVTDVFITDDPGFDLFLGKFTSPGTIAPTPLVNSLSISVRDLPARITEFLYDALDNDVALNPGHYLLRGDFSGIIPIQSVQFIGDPLVNGQPATGTIVLEFVEPLPDDRFTLTISDSLVDPAGNSLDGETNAVEPTANPFFPSGDGQPGGDFSVRFTVDSRPELGVWAAGSVWVDTNGNFTFDPGNPDFVNRDITYVMGFTSDHIFAGNFRDAGPDGIAGTADDGAADGFDKLAAYGKVGTQFRWLIDTDNDGVSDPPRGIVDPAAVNGLPISGNFNPAIPGDQVGLFDGTRWHFDTTGNYNVNETVTIPGMVGYPIAGDFNGDGLVDLGTWADDTFHISLAGTPGGVGSLGWSTTLISFRFGFIGVRERPVAADMDQDGFADLGLWVPDRSGVNPSGGGEWYFLVSGGDSVLDRIVDDAAGAPFIPFTPVPFGNDLYREYGNEFALPIVGNFDPPPGRGEANVVGEAPNQHDVDANGSVEPLDALIVLNFIARHGNGAPAPLSEAPPFPDVNRDGSVNPLDALLVLNYLSQSAAQSMLSGEGESAGRWSTSAAPTPTQPAVEESEQEFEFNPSDLDSPADAWQADSAWDDLVDTLAASTRSGTRAGLLLGSPNEEEESDREALVDSVLLDFDTNDSAW